MFGGTRDSEIKKELRWSGEMQGIQIVGRLKGGGGVNCIVKVCLESKAGDTSPKKYSHKKLTFQTHAEVIEQV